MIFGDGREESGDFVGFEVVLVEWFVFLSLCRDEAAYALAEKSNIRSGFKYP